MSNKAKRAKKAAKTKTSKAAAARKGSVEGKASKAKSKRNTPEFKQYSFYIPAGLKAKLESLSKKSGKTQSELILNGITRILG